MVARGGKVVRKGDQPGIEEGQSSRRRSPKGEVPESRQDGKEANERPTRAIIGCWRAKGKFI